MHEHRGKKKKLDLYEFMVRFPGSAADVLRLTLLSPHVHGYAGEKNTWVSHMSKAATASIITLPAIYTYKHVQWLDSSREWFGSYWPLIDTSIYSAFTLLQKELIIFLLCLSYSHLLVIQVGSRCMVSFFISETQTEPHYLFIFCHRVAYYFLDCSLSVSLFISFAGREVTRSYCAVLLSPRWRDSEPAGSHSIRLIRDRVTPAMPRGCN